MGRFNDGMEGIFVALPDALVHLPDGAEDHLHENGGLRIGGFPRGNLLRFGIENVIAPHVLNQLRLVDPVYRSVDFRELAKREAPS